jgi:NEDD8-activating enzyme E1 regulatory subunit
MGLARQGGGETSLTSVAAGVYRLWNGAMAGEMCRFGAAELHCVAAVMGGMAAQEAIKLITHQFVPLAGTLVYNAMASTTLVLNV